MPKIEWVVQWSDSGFFRRGHPQLCNSPTTLVGLLLESTGPRQRNGTSFAFMRCVVRNAVLLV